MTLDELKQAFLDAQETTKHTDFETIYPKRSQYPDLHSFMRLSELLPKRDGDFVTCAEHDQIWPNVDVEALAAVADVAFVKEMVACGVWFDSQTDSLSMFV